LESEKEVGRQIAHAGMEAGVVGVLERHELFVPVISFIVYIRSQGGF
jgi:hypothetical protein